MKKLFRFVGIIWFIYIIFTLLIHRLQDRNLPTVDSCEDMFLEDSLTEDRLHMRSWNVNITDYCLQYFTTANLFEKTSLHRSAIKPTRYSYEEYWGDVYAGLLDKQIGSVKFLADSLTKVSGDLSPLEKADLVVKFIQDIPYSYIDTNDCSEKDPNKPCVPHVEHGLYAPYEFIHSESGDCDTRAVLLYGLLSEMGFDPMIVISREYLHAMIALNIPATGDYMDYRQKKYYFWETTAKGWSIGMLPPDFNDISYWKIALVNES